MARREFQMPPDDTEYLDATFPDWEAIVMPNGNWILIPNFSFPEGFTTNSALAAIQVLPNYPVAGLDMVYFYPAVCRSDGVAIPRTESTMNIDGKIFQRWSRHYLNGQWVVGESNIHTHIMAIRNWLEKASSKKVA
jgi:hypothetical protein